MGQKDSDTFLDRYLGTIVLTGGIIILVCPILLTRKFGFFDFTETGQIGDTIGGLTAPFIGLLSVLVVYKAWTAQISANKELRRQISEQRTEIQRTEEFESLNRLYSHIENTVTSFQFVSLDTNDLKYEDGFQVNTERLTGIYAFYEMFDQINCHYHSDLERLSKEPAVIEVVGILALMSFFLKDVRGSKMCTNSQKELLSLLCAHLFYFKVFARLTDAKLKRYFCDDCSLPHGLPTNLRRYAVQIKWDLRYLDRAIQNIDESMI